jgi:hypothetical protein
LVRTTLKLIGIHEDGCGGQLRIDQNGLILNRKGNQLALTYSMAVLIPLHFSPQALEFPPLDPPLSVLL